jgi:short subunit dehydrogenase-like uncharacterized protein
MGRRSHLWAAGDQPPSRRPLTVTAAGTLVVLGATGSTGSRVASLAAKAGLPTAIVGRRQSPLEQIAAGTALEVRVGSLDPADLDRVCAGAAVIVSGVGPYTAFGRAAVEAALRAGAHYVDFSGEPRWVHTVATEYGPAAVDAGVRLVPSVGLGAAGDLAARLAAASVRTVDTLTVAYKLIGMKPSAATARSTIEIIAGGAPRHHSSGAVTFRRAGARSRRLPGGRGAQFPTPDAIALGAMWPRADIESFMQTPVPALSGRALSVAATLLGHDRIAGAARSGLDRWAGHSEHAGGGGRARATAVIEGSGRRVTAQVHVHDVYQFTARAGFAAVEGLFAGNGVPGLQSWGQITGDPVQRAAELDAQVGTITSVPI